MVWVVPDSTLNAAEPDTLPGPGVSLAPCYRGWEEQHVNGRTFWDTDLGAVAQWSEQGTHNPSVAGSIPAGPTRVM